MSHVPLIWLAGSRALDGIAKSGLYATLSFHLYLLTDSGAWGVAPFTVLYATSIISAPLGGWLLDRFGPRTVAPISLGVEAMLVVGLVLVDSPAALVALCVLISLVESPYSAATAHLIGQNTDDIASWVGRVQGARVLGACLGPVLIGLLLQISGASLAFGVVAALLAVSLFPLLIAIHDCRQVTVVTDLGFDRDTLVAGLHALWSDRDLRAMTIAMVLCWLALSGASPAEIGVADTLGGGSLAYGVINAVIAAASLLGLALVARAGARRESVALSIALVILVVAYLGAASASSFVLLLGFLALSGVVDGVTASIEQVAVLARVDEERQGRALIAMETVTTIGSLVPLLFAGFLLDAFGVSLIFIGCAAVAGCALLALLPLLRRSSSPVLAPSES